MPRQKVILIGVNTMDFKAFFLCLNCQWLLTFYVLAAETYSITATRNAWVGDLVCLYVMENRNCIEQWMAEGATALKKVCGMDSRR